MHTQKKTAAKRETKGAGKGFKYKSIDDYVPEKRKVRRQVFYMADTPNSKLSRKFEQPPIFWKGSKAKEVAKKLNGQYVKVELIW